MYVTERKQPADYCSHCDCNHVIGQHPRDGESKNQYWSRMKVLDKRLRKDYGDQFHDSTLNLVG